MNIRGLGRLLLLLSQKKSMKLKNSFIAEHKYLLQKNINDSPCNFKGTLLGYSGNNYFYEQLYSSLSFIKNVGLPEEWIIVSDGTYTIEQIKILQQIPNLRVIDFDEIFDHNFKQLKPLADGHRLGKFATTYYSLLNNIKDRIIYLEADVLVFQSFKKYIHLFDKGNWYLPDTAPHLDSAYFIKNKMPMFSVNNGFAIFNERPPLEVACNYFSDRINNGELEYFTPQSASQLMAEEDSASNFFDPRNFVVSCSDHFKFSIDHLPNNVALRHFVGPVRHKMWQTDWKDVLKY